MREDVKIWKVGVCVGFATLVIGSVVALATGSSEIGIISTIGGGVIIVGGFIEGLT